MSIMNRVRAVLGVAVALVGLAGPGVSEARAQAMDLSHYGDQFVDEPSGAISAYFNVIDNTQGCSHSNYYMEIAGSTPGASWGTSNYGTSVVGGVSLNDEGTYFAESSVWFDCSCGGSFFYGGGTYVDWWIKAEAYRHHYERITIGNPSTYILMQDSAGRRCSHQSLTWPSSPSPEPSWLTDSGVYYSLWGDPLACLSVCAGGTNGTVLGPTGPMLDDASCG